METLSKALSRIFWGSSGPPISICHKLSSNSACKVIINALLWHKQVSIVVCHDELMDVALSQGSIGC